MGVIAVLLVLGVVPDNAFAQTTIDFNGFANGLRIDTEIAFPTFSSSGGPINDPVIFDEGIIQGGDPDLNGPDCVPGTCDGDWDVGNLAPDTVLDKMLIVQENGGDCDAFSCSPPDDRAAGGTITVDFQGTDICSWRTALIDIEGPNDPELGDFKFFLTGFGQVASIAFEDLGGLGTLGDNSANTFNTITSAGLGSSFDKVEIIFDGSGAVDNITFQECDVIGGHGKIMDKTSLLVSGAQLTSSWMIPLLVSSIGIGVFVVTRK